MKHCNTSKHVLTSRHYYINSSSAFKTKTQVNSNETKYVLTYTTQLQEYSHNKPTNAQIKTKKRVLLYKKYHAQVAIDTNISNLKKTPMTRNLPI